jgi:hypothetical protein
VTVNAGMDSNYFDEAMVARATRPAAPPAP